MNKPLAAGAIMLGVLASAALLAPAATRAGILNSPVATHVENRLMSPGSGHWLGTDGLGRDVLSRLVHGSRASLLVAFVATAVALLIGVPAGALAGARGGAWDLLLTRLMEATAGLPALPLILLIVSLTLGEGRERETATLLLLAAAIGVTRWAAIARYVRGGVWKTRVEEYATAAVALGAGRIRLLFKHLLPGALAPALVSAAFGAGSAVLLESALSFLGLGVQLPTPSWGRMVAAAVDEPQAWWLLLAPGAAIALLVMGFNMLAEGIRLQAEGEPAGRKPGKAQVANGLRLPLR